MHGQHSDEMPLLFL